MECAGMWSVGGMWSVVAMWSVVGMWSVIPDWLAGKVQLKYVGGGQL